jgi:ABC-type glycerol-3-phosphate transport system substrate-binding protein
MRNFKLLALAFITIAVVAVIAVLFLLRPFQPASNAFSTPAPVANTTRSQGSSVKLTIAIPNFLGSLFTDRLISAFESSHPGVKLTLVKIDANIPPAALGLDQHFRAVEQYTSAADVVYVASTSYLGNTTRLSVEATRAGYVLNLKPLVNIDTKLNPDDFFPALWQSYQWDQGIWALPLAADPYVLTYLPSAFDTARIAYPADQWTLDDLTSAIRQLSLKDADGKVIRAGIDVYGAQVAVALRGLLKNSYIDTNALPNTPKFDTPEIALTLQDWLKLDRDGMIGTEFNKAPLSIAPAITVAVPGANAEKRYGTLLPGGQAMLATQGFAVSGGTQFPQQAYLLAQWLTTRNELTTNVAASTPARKSLLGAAPSDTMPFTFNITPDLKALITKAIDSAIPVSETRFADYLASAYDKMKTSNVDAQVALQAAQSEALKNQRDAANRKGTLVLAVKTPMPEINLPPGKIALKVAVVQPQITNQEAWNKLIDDFTAGDSQVAKVWLENYFDLTAASDVLAKSLLTYDCVYAPFNAVSPDRVPKMLNLDSLLTADPAFDKSDMLGNTLSQVTLDNKIWMLPADISPYVLKYDSERFSRNGVPLPSLTWTIDEFADTLKTLKADATGKPGFIPTNTFGTYIFQLVAAYGGNPIDYRTNPPTINFSDPATIDAIQQVVTLAKDGYFKYRPLFGQGLDIAFQPEPSTIRQITLTSFSLESLVGAANENDNDSTKLTLYPKGRKFSAVTFNLGGFYISATAQNPEACYRFISKAARTPALFPSMPARRSLLNDQTLVAAQGADTIALYKQIATLLDDPNTLPLPGLSLGSSSLQGRAQLMSQLELFAALDKVILRNADLAASLKDAETSAKAFQECAASLPALDPNSVDSQRAYIDGFAKCAIKADPAMAPFFAAIKTN